MRGSSEGEMTNGCPVLILFVVKSTLIHDCLAETALHLTQFNTIRGGQPRKLQSCWSTGDSLHSLKHLHLPEAAIHLLVSGSLHSGCF